MARASTTAENNALTGSAGLTTQAAYFGANTGDPGTTGASEVSGGSYVRQSITWGTASSGSVANSNAIAVPIPASTTVDYGSTWGASTGTGSGGYQVGMALSSTIDFVTAGTLSVAIGALTLSVS